MTLSLVLTLVAFVLAGIEVVRTRGQSVLAWAVFLGFLGLTLEVWRSLL